MVIADSLRIAGDEFDEAIIKYMKTQYNLVIGERMAEEVKFRLGNVFPEKKVETMELKGRDAISGLPRTLEIDSVEIRKSLKIEYYEKVFNIKYVDFDTTYNFYLSSPAWQEKRRNILERDNHSCSLCGFNKKKRNYLFAINFEEFILNYKIQIYNVINKEVLFNFICNDDEKCELNDINDWLVVILYALY